MFFAYSNERTGAGELNTGKNMDTFDSKYSPWFLPLTNRQKQQYERLKQLVLSFNQNLENEVTRAKDKYNLKVRGVIAEKTGISLTFRIRDIDKKMFDNTDKSNIPIRLVDRVPSSLLALLEKFDDTQIELLLHYRRMKSAAKELNFQIQRYSIFQNTIKNQQVFKSLTTPLIIYINLSKKLISAVYLKLYETLAQTCLVHISSKKIELNYIGFVSGFAVLCTICLLRSCS